jgi:hypothetical protein
MVAPHAQFGYADLMSADSFAHTLVCELRHRDGRAAVLKVGGRGKTAVIGIEDDGEFVPLLRVAHASAKYNVMNLDVRHQRSWAPTFHRGTPSELAEALAGTLQHLWTIPLAMAQVPTRRRGRR